MKPHDQSTDPSSEPWVTQHRQLIYAGGSVLDLACGAGRHTRLLHSLGYQVTAVDISIKGVDDLAGHPGIELRQHDLETEAWPLEGCRFDGIVVTNYLHRPHLERLADNLSDRGVLLYSTFAVGHEAWGRPRNPDFLLRPGELFQAFEQRLQVVAFEEGVPQNPPAPVRQSICAVAAQHPAAQT